MSTDRTYHDPAPGPAEQAAASIVDWSATVESFARQLAEQMEPVAKAIRQIATAVAPLAAEWTVSLAKLAPVLQEASRFVETAPTRAREAFLAAGYPPTDLITIGEVRAIVEAHETGSRESLLSAVAAAVDEITETSHGRRLLRLRWSGSSLLSHGRIRILRDALKAHRLRLFGVSVPAMIAQTEGLIADAYAHKNAMNGAQYKAYLKRAARDDSLFGPLLEAFANEVLLTHFSHGSPVASDLSRHAILHGGDIHYASRETSAKAIFLFDYVLNLVEPGRSGMPLHPSRKRTTVTPR